MLIKTSLLFLILSLSTLSAHEFICADSGQKKIMHFNNEGELIWSIEKVNVRDMSLLKNGNILFSQQPIKGSKDGRISEITRDKKTAWEYSAKGELTSCQRLENGNTLIANSSTGEILEVTKDGQVALKFKIKSNHKKNHTRIRRARKGFDGLYYVAQHGDGTLNIYNSKGECLHEIIHLQNVSEVGKTAKINACYLGLPLLNGEILLTGLSEMKIVNKDGKVTWRITAEDIPEMNIFYFTDAQVLANGNIVVSNWLGHGNSGKGTPIVELTRNKKVVWTLSDSITTKSITAVHVIK